MFHACSEALDVMSQLKAQAATWTEELAKSKRGKGIPFTCPSLKGNSHLKCFKEGTRTLERCLPTSNTTFPRPSLIQRTSRPMTKTRLASPPALDLPVESPLETPQVSILLVVPDSILLLPKTNSTSTALPLIISSTPPHCTTV